MLRTSDGGQTYADLTAAVSDGDPGTYGHLDSLGTATDGAWLLVGGKAPFAAVAISMNAAANGNAAELTAEYRDGATWASVDGLTDGSAQDGKTLARDGEVRFDEPAVWRRATINGVEAFWLRLTVQAALDSSTRINELAVREVRKADAFVVIGSQLARVSSETGAPRLSTAVDGGSDSTWTKGVPVGDGAYAVSALLSLGSRAYLVKEDGLHALRPGAEGGAVAEHLWSQPVRRSSPHDGRARRRLARLPLAAAAAGVLSLPARRPNALRSGTAAGERFTDPGPRHRLRGRRPLPVRGAAGRDRAHHPAGAQPRAGVLASHCAPGTGGLPPHVGVRLARAQPAVVSRGRRIAGGHRAAARFGQPAA